MSAIKSIVALFFVFVAVSNAFSLSRSSVARRVSLSRPSSLSMMWDTKKLSGGRAGQGIVEITAPKISEEEVIANMFRRAPPGSGMDERSPSILSDDLQDLESAQISRMDKAFRQHSLKMTLEGDYAGTAAKLFRIEQASSLEGTLPANFMNGASKVVNMKAGGLMADWDATF